VDSSGTKIQLDKQQDCISIARSKRDGIAFRRKFDTCDEEDFMMHEGTMFLYWMRGTDLLDIQEHSLPMPDLKEGDYGMTHLQLLRSDKVKIPEK